MYQKKQPMTCKQCTATATIIVVTWLAISSVCTSDSDMKINTTDHVIFGNMTTEERLHSHNYDHTIRPYFIAGRPCDVTVQIHIITLGPLIQLQLRYGMELFLRQRWIDPRLANPDRKTMDTLNQKTMDLLWVPGLYIVNEMDGVFHDITTPNRLMHVQPNGHITFSQRFTMTLMCRYDLIKFPLDQQVCQIQLESYSDKNDQLRFFWDKKVPFELPKNGLNIAEFVLLRSETADCTRTYSTGTFSCIVGKFFFRRKITYYLMRTYLPTSLFVSLSWISFWIDEGHMGARITLGMLTVLTTTAQSNMFSQDLPRLSYVKAIDVWMSTCLMFVFAGVLEFCAMLIMQRQLLLKMTAEMKLEEEEIQKRHAPHLTKSELSFADSRKPCQVMPTLPELPEGNASANPSFAGDTDVISYAGDSKVVPYAEDANAVVQTDDVNIVPYTCDTKTTPFSGDTETKPCVCDSKTTPCPSETDTVPTKTGEYRGSSRRVSAWVLPELAQRSKRQSVATNRLSVVSHWLPVTYYGHRLSLSEMPTTCRCCYAKSRRHRDPLIDNISKVLFPVTFAIFNVIYWAYYISD